jgi:CRISPR type III-B/RAMP module-associated protein Cmr5
MAFFDPVNEAFTVALKYSDLAERCRETSKENIKLGGPIAKKAKELPGLIASAGLVPGLAFYLSKSDDDNLYQSMLEYLLDKNALLQNCSENDKLKNELLKELGGSEKKGYTTLLAATAYAINQITGKDLSDKKKLIETLKDIHQDITMEAIIEAQVLQYLQELKKLAVALFEEEEKQ